MDQDSPLSDEEKNALLQAARRNRAARKREETNERQNISTEEYVKRLEAARKKDLNVLSKMRDKRTSKASAEWAQKVGPTFADATTEIPQVLERVERLKTRQGLHKTSILFYGNQFGRGKTWAAYAYLNTLVRLGVFLPGQIYFGTESSTLSRVANSGYERTEEMLEMKRDRHKVFFIDDVGQGYFFKKENREEVWYELIDHIYTRRLTLILTTNLEFTEKGLGYWIGARAFDRLRTLVGNDGAIMLTGVNKREAIFRQNEAQYRKNRSN